MLDQIAIVDEVHGLAFIDAGRPARDIAGYALTAIENIQLLDTRLRMDSCAADHARQNQRQGPCNSSHDHHSRSCPQPLHTFYDITATEIGADVEFIRAASGPARPRAGLTGTTTSAVISAWGPCDLPM